MMDQARPLITFAREKAIAQWKTWRLLHPLPESRAVVSRCPGLFLRAPLDGMGGYVTAGSPSLGSVGAMGSGLSCVLGHRGSGPRRSEGGATPASDGASLLPLAGGGSGTATPTLCRGECLRGFPPTSLWLLAQANPRGSVAALPGLCVVSLESLPPTRQGR